MNNYLKEFKLRIVALILRNLETVNWKDDWWTKRILLSADRYLNPDSSRWAFNSKVKDVHKLESTVHTPILNKSFTTIASKQQEILKTTLEVTLLTQSYVSECQKTG